MLGSSPRFLLALFGQRGEDGFDERVGNLRGNRFVRGGLSEEHRLLVRLEIRNTRWAHAKVLLEFRTYVLLELVVPIAADEFNELLTGHVSPRPAGFAARAPAGEPLHNTP